MGGGRDKPRKICSLAIILYHIFVGEEVIVIMMINVILIVLYTTQYVKAQEFVRFLSNYSIISEPAQ